MCVCVCVCVCFTVYDELKLRKEELSQLEERHKQLSAPLQYSDSKEKKLFDKCMGLEFRLTEDHAVSLVYTSLHPDDAERRFIITLDIDEDDQDKWKGISGEAGMARL